MNLFENPCDYDRYNFAFKSNIKNPKKYEEMAKVLTSDKLENYNLEEYKKLSKCSDMDIFYLFIFFTFYSVI